MPVLPPFDRAPLPPLTVGSFADTLAQRFGAPIAAAVRRNAGLGSDDDPLPLETVRQAIAMALDAELVQAGVAFALQAPMSALAGAPGFRRAAERAGIRPDRLDLEQRLRIDAAFLRRWDEEVGPAPVNGDDARALALMASVLLNEPY